MAHGNVTVKSEMANIPDKPAVRSVLASCSILNPLTEQETRGLEESCFMAYAERGELLWLTGTPIQFVSVVGVGFVKMTRTTPQGSEVAVELLGPGQCLGLLAAIEGRVYPLNAVAVTNTWYLKIASKSFVDIYHANPLLRDTLLRSLAPRLRKAHEMMARMSSGKIECRLAAVLLILMGSYGKEASKGTILSVPLTRQDLAEMAGTTVETAIRVMSKWQKAKVLTTDHQRITICDTAYLEQMLSS